MTQCVPSWEVEDNIPTTTKIPLLPNSNSNSNSNSIAIEVPMFEFDSQVAELTYKKGQLLTQGLRPMKPLHQDTTRNLTTWDKPSIKDTLESMVNKSIGEDNNHENKMFPWFNPHRNTMTMDALVPCSFTKDRSMNQVTESEKLGACVGKRARVMARVPIRQELSGCKNWSVSGSETCHRDLSEGLNSGSMGSPENTTRTTANDHHDSIHHRKSQSEAGDEDNKTTRIDKSLGSNKKNKAAAVHNQSERRRRDKINQRLKALQKLVPYSSKTDKASMLDEVIQYMKQLQAQVQMMNWMKMYSTMMLPITMQQQLKMSMMAHMGMGMGKNMGMSMGMDMNTINIPGIPPMFPPSPFMPMASWNACGGDGLLGAQSKCVSMDAYSKMAAQFHHQLYHPPPSSSKS
ncbi:hypothetical protein VNO77_07268 [Canavalia gladiata]|uniref:BHLH domain-containing protein n=1 Tax=Canavalia gladiata TaxID=3824 RepID=A0AAN9MD57_CANGL